MHTPPRGNAQGQRRSSKQHNQKDAGQRSVQSDNDAYQGSHQDGDQTPSKSIKQKQRKKSHSQKHNGAQSEAGEYSDGMPYKNTPRPEKTKATPIKQQAYAGPTFHQSPAASALPMPSFYSRSVPNPGPIESIAEAPAESNSHTYSSVSHTTDGAGREGTPLDFLFDAARKAQSPNETGSGYQPHVLSPPAQRTHSRSPVVRGIEGDFPFELDTPDRTPGESASGVSTPFKDRLEAARSPWSISDGSPNLTEEERKAKTAALKKALATPQGFDQLTNAFRDTNPFNARSAPPSQGTPMRHSSNPTTPSAHPQVHAGASHPHYFAQRGGSPSRTNQLQNQNRPPSSNLRNVYEPQPNELHANHSSHEASTSATGMAHTQPNTNFANIYGEGKKNSAQSAQQQPNMQQGLDDLRKVLNLDLVGRG